jgi:hypothetical protein
MPAQRWYLTALRFRRRLRPDHQRVKWRACRSSHRSARGQAQTSLIAALVPAASPPGKSELTNFRNVQVPPRALPYAASSPGAGHRRYSAVHTTLDRTVSDTTKRVWFSWQPLLTTGGRESTAALSRRACGVDRITVEGWAFPRAESTPNPRMANLARVTRIGECSPGLS